MRVADYIFKYLADYGIEHVFLVAGGGSMHLNDALGKEKRISYVCNHHEQASAIAAEGYARLSGKIGVVGVTSGPGGTNAITGVMGAWVDSIPILVISGQVKRDTTIVSEPELNLRQLGDQEINITDIVKPITKYSVMVTDKNDIKYHLQKALYLAKNDRPGPVWIDVPLDIQGALIEEEDLKEFAFPVENKSDYKVDEVLTLLRNSKRPIIIAGNGVRLADAVDCFNLLVKKLNIPVLTSISGVDLIESADDLFFGRPGILGERAANFIMQNSDLILILGARMHLRILSFNWEYFARDAVKIMVDVDANELKKRTININVPIEADVGDFIYELLSKSNLESRNYKGWIDYCERLKRDYPVITKEHQEKKNYVNSNYFAWVLSSFLPPSAVVVTGNGTAYTSTFQSFQIKKGQRLFANVGCASMGYDLPAAIGACVANNCGEVFCITGDGSIQMNLQELQTIIHHRFPVKIFMFNNEGYLSIRTTQKDFFNGNFVGESKSSGVSTPNMIKLAEVYGFKTYSISNHSELEEILDSIINYEGAVFCEVFLDPEERLGPKVASFKRDDGTMVSRPLEDLAPFLTREKFYRNMIIPAIEDDPQ